MPLPWYIEYWYIPPTVVAMFCTVVLPFMYVRWLRKPWASEPQELVKRLATFYKALAVVCFIPVISPSSWLGVYIAYIVLPIISPTPTGSEGRVGGGAGIAMMLMVCFLFSLVIKLALLCNGNVASAAWRKSFRSLRLNALRCKWRFCIKKLVP